MHGPPPGNDFVLVETRSSIWASKRGSRYSRASQQPPFVPFIRALRSFQRALRESKVRSQTGTDAKKQGKDCHETGCATSAGGHSCEGKMLWLSGPRWGGGGACVTAALPSPLLTDPGTCSNLLDWSHILRPCVRCQWRWSTMSCRLADLHRALASDHACKTKT